MGLGTIPFNEALRGVAMKLRVTAVAIVVIAGFVTGPAHASKATLDRAINDAVRDYKTGGVEGLVEASSVCYPARKRFADNGEQVDYCVAYDIAANKILQVKGIELPEYFTGMPMLVRQTGEAEAAGLFVGPDGLAEYMQSRLSYVQKRVAGKL
jgi:hypothetical protein